MSNRLRQKVEAGEGDDEGGDEAKTDDRMEMRIRRLKASKHTPHG